MSEIPQEPRKKRSVLLIVSLCLALLAVAAAVYLMGSTEDHSFSMLILGDSQMAGSGWEGGYANCVSETYPNALVINLAQPGSLLANGDIHQQWEFFLSEASYMPDYVLLDGGANDLPHLQKEEFKENGLELVSYALCDLIERIHEENPDTHIIYTLMPPLLEWKDSDDGPPAYDVQRRYWKQLHRIANAYDYVTVVDLFSINPFQFPSQGNYRKYFADSIHLNEAGYRKSFEYIRNILTAQLEMQEEEDASVNGGSD